MVQRGHNFAIVDEVDSILIDEARTPLIISGQGEDSTELYEMADALGAPHERKQVICRQTDDGRGPGRPATATTSWTKRPSTATLTATRHRQGRSSTSALRTSPTRRTRRSSHHINQAHQGPRRHEAGHRLCRQGRPGHHRRRVHRPPDVRPPLQRGPASGHRGQGGHVKVDSEKQDACDHHVPELTSACTASSPA